MLAALGLLPAEPEESHAPQAGTTTDGTATGSQTTTADEGEEEETIKTEAGTTTVGNATGSRAKVADAASEDDDEDNDAIEVWLHVYDLGEFVGQLNEMFLRDASMGAYHVGVEVLGEEWSYQGFHDAFHDPSLTGLMRGVPKQNWEFVYKESVLLGKTPLTEEAVEELIQRLKEEWPANEYHIVSKNCVTFSEEFAARLQVKETVPEWVKGAVDNLKAPGLFAIADYGWSWFKWHCQRQADAEAAEMEAEDAARAKRAASAVADAAAAAHFSSSSPSAEGCCT